MIVVLYKMLTSQSVAVHTLLDVFTQYPKIGGHFSLILYDNSPEPHSEDLGLNIPVSYRHDPTNAGLAAAYNYALDSAEQSRHEWLLLLDQDTTLTYEFVTELIARAIEIATQEDVAAIVPRLMVNGVLHSPAANFLDQLRHQYRRSNHAISREVVGVQRGRFSVYNSAATLRVSSLWSIGGFPEEYWLDYLDHAVFHSLFVEGFSIYIMNSVLHHEASQANPGLVPLWRERNLLFAQAHFVRQTGTLLDRFLYRIWLLRRSKDLFLCDSKGRLWIEAAVQAILLREDVPARGTKQTPPPNSR
jgi:GT2 family glycosyltransferase